jgi:conjugative transposon TraM protein
MKDIKFDKKMLKFFGFVSLMVVICLAVIAWVFLPAKNVSDTAKKKGGLNMQVPGADVKKDSTKDKMSFYAQRQIDSAKHADEIRMDPNRKDSVIKIPEQVVSKTVTANSKALRPVKSSSDNDQLERIRSLQRQLSASTANDYSVEDAKTFTNQNPPQRKIVQSSPDPEMEAINTTLDKIMAIQNPKNNTAVTGTVNQPGYSVTAGEENDATYFGKRNSGRSQQIFLDDAARQSKSVSVLTATIASEQELMSGATVKLDLSSSVSVNGVRVPAGTAIFGIASIEGERLHITIPSIRYQNNILPVSLNVYDLDGLEGIYIPGSVARDVVKESADGAIQSTGVAGFGLSLKTQVAAAGIGAAKSLLSKKVKQVRVTVTAGYKVLLRDNKQTGY